MSACIGLVINHEESSLKPAGENPEEGPWPEDTRCSTISGSASRIGCPAVPASQEHRTTACLSMPCRYRAGIPWRDLPARFADFRVAHLRHSRWSYSGVWQQVFEALAQQADNEYAMIDSTIVRAPPARCRDKRGAPQAIGHSHGGLSAKIHAAADALSHRISSHAKAGARPRRSRRALGSNSGRNRDRRQGL